MNNVQVLGFSATVDEFAFSVLTLGWVTGKASGLYKLTLKTPWDGD